MAKPRGRVGGSYERKRIRNLAQEVAPHPGARGAGISFVLSFQKSQKYAKLETHLNT